MNKLRTQHNRDLWSAHNEQNRSPVEGSAGAGPSAPSESPKDARRATPGDVSPALPSLDEIVLRPMEDGDFEFILKCWLRAHCHGSKEAQLAGKSYWTEHRQLVMRLLTSAATLVATWSKDPHLVIGFATTEAGKVHFVYVRKSFWRMGIARRLLAGMLSQENVVYTHRTHMVVGLPVPPTWSYNPYEAR